MPKQVKSLIGHTQKLKNLTFSGYPAVKVIYETKPQNKKPSLPNETSKPIFSYDVIDYIRKGKDIWKVVSLAFNKKQ